MISDKNERHAILLNTVSCCIGSGSKKGFEYAVIESREYGNVLAIRMDDPERIQAAVKRLSKGNFDKITVVPMNHGGEIECTLE
jgi:hypothetical protein